MGHPCNEHICIFAAVNQFVYVIHHSPPSITGSPIVCRFRCTVPCIQIQIPLAIPDKELPLRPWLPQGRNVHAVIHRAALRLAEEPCGRVWLVLSLYHWHQPTVRNVKRFGAHFPAINEVKELVVMLHVHPISKQAAHLRSSVQCLILRSALLFCGLLQLLCVDQLAHRLLCQWHSKSLGPRSEPCPHHLQRRIINAFFCRNPARYIHHQCGGIFGAVDLFQHLHNHLFARCHRRNRWHHQCSRYGQWQQASWRRRCHQHRAIIRYPLSLSSH